MLQLLGPNNNLHDSQAILEQFKKRRNAIINSSIQPKQQITQKRQRDFDIAKNFSKKQKIVSQSDDLIKKAELLRDEMTRQIQHLESRELKQGDASNQLKQNNTSNQLNKQSKLSKYFVPPPLERVKYANIESGYVPHQITIEPIVAKPYQRRTIELIRENRSAIICYDTGLGKTYVAVMASQEFLSKHPSQEVFVCTSPSLVANFKKELKKHGFSERGYNFLSFQGLASAFWMDQNVLKGHMLIIDEAHHLRTNIVDKLDKKIKLEISKLETDSSDYDTDSECKIIEPKELVRKEHEQKELELLGEAADLIDEHRHDDQFNFFKAIYFGIGLKKNIYSTACLVMEASREAVKVLQLTATPFMNYPRDISNLISIAKNEGIYSDEYIESKLEQANTNDDSSFFKNLFYFQFKNTNDPEFPTVTIKDVPLTISYADYMEHIRNQSGSRDAFRLKSRMSGNSVPQKVEWIMNFLEKNKGKTLIFSNFHGNGIDRVIQELNKSGRRYVSFHGKINTKKRKEYFDIFNDPNSNVDVCLTTNIGAEGLDYKGVRSCIVMESQWNEPIIKQVIGRVVRRGGHSHLPKEEQSVTIYHLMVQFATQPSTDKEEQTYVTADKSLKDISSIKDAVCEKHISTLKKFDLLQTANKI
jgi:superfamily II DNA or RNA helicase